MIEASGLYKHFGSVAAVNGLSFSARDGSITGLLGSNGAGKTTTLRMIAGVLQPQAGEIRIDDAREPISLQRRVGALLDHTGLYSRLTARENIAYFGRLREIPPGRLEQRVEDLLLLLGLRSIADRRVAGFSQGERMKTALGRALIHSPKNLLLDEPTNGLDVHAIRSIRAILKAMRDSGVCVVLSTHVLEEVRALCDSVVIVAKGSLIAQGSPEDLCRRACSSSLEDAFVKLTEASTC